MMTADRQILLSQARPAFSVALREAFVIDGGRARSGRGANVPTCSISNAPSQALAQAEARRAVLIEDRGQ
jgi:hypothetical protein